MENELKLEIVNDTPFRNLKYILTLDHKAEKVLQKQAILRREVKSETRAVPVKVRKKDVWNSDQHNDQRFWLLLDVLDVFFGSLSDADHLPVSIEYKDEIDTARERKILLISRIMRSNPKNVARWTRYTTAQYILVSVLLFFFVLLFSVAIPGLFKALWIGGCAAAIAGFLVFRIKSRNKLKKDLLVYAGQDDEESAPSNGLEASGEQ